MPTPRPLRSFGALLGVLCVLGVPAAAATPTASAPANPADRDRLDGWIEQRMDAHGIPGAAVAIVQNGETVHLAGYGQAGPDGRTVNPETPFLTGSVSKPFTATLVRQLVEEGRLSLDEPALPWLDPLVTDTPDGFEQVTIRQLLTHTAGIGMAVGLPGTVPVHVGPDALDRRVAEVLGHPLATAPGDRYEYSNAGYALLAAVVEQVTGQPFHQVLNDRIFEPLDMNDSFATGDAPAAERLATGHRQWFGRWRPADLEFDPAGTAYGYLGSSAQDLARFLHAHLDHPAPDVIPTGAAGIAAEPTLPTGWDMPLEATQGRGWMVDEIDGHAVVSHAGSLGHVTGHLIMVPDADGLGIAVVTNASAFIAAGHISQYDLSLGLAHLLLGYDTPADTASPLLTLGAPLTSWALLAAVIGLVLRFVWGTRRAASGSVAVRPFRWWRHIVLPAAGYLALGVTLMLALPLGAARHFYPDVGWALTAVTHLAIAWAVVRTALAIVTRRRAVTAARSHQMAGQPPGRPEVRDAQLTGAGRERRVART
jgi:CubicO group peptidase (beta-lactamase class C family)